MSLQKYAEYKESGIEWLGEIPSHWFCVSLKNIEPYNSQMVQTGPFGAQLHASDYVDEGVPLILIKNVRNLSIDDSDIPKISAEDAKRLSIYRVEVGDIVFSRVGSIGRIAKITEKERGWLISGQMLRLRLGSNLLNPEYSVYALSSKIVEDYVTYYSVGSTRDSINTEILKNLKIPLPPLREQKQIAAFLDKETTKIDTLIDKQEQLITLLGEKRQAIISYAVTRGLNPNVKMKDSGIEWLGVVPEHWEVSHLRWFISLKSGEGLSDSQFSKETLDEDSYPVIGGNGTMGYSKHFNTTQKAFAIGRVGALCGNVHFLKEKCWITDNALKVSKWEGFNDSYFEYMLRAANLNQYANQSAQPLITGEQVKALPVPRLPLKEQKRIAAYLDKETAKSDTLIEKCETAIELLKERRTALISAAVTGKIDVRNAV